MLGSLLNKVVGLQACSFVKETPEQVFPVDITKFLRQPILKSICKWLLLDGCNGSLLQGPKGSWSIFILYGSIRLQDPSHKFSFSFLSWHLWSSIKS